MKDELAPPVTDLNALIERLERVRNQLTPGVIEAADLDGMALSVGDGIKALRTLAERQPVGDGEVTQADRDFANELSETGWVFVHPDILARELAKHRQAAEQRGADRAFEEAAVIAEKRAEYLKGNEMYPAYGLNSQVEALDHIADAIRQRIGGQ